MSSPDCSLVLFDDENKKFCPALFVQAIAAAE
jgi:hypothetical protein